MKKSIKIITIINRALLTIIGLILLIGIGLTVIKTYNRYANRILSPSGIEESRYININGQKQWIYIRGENRENPMVLFLHGGPGSPETHMASKKYQGELEKYFTVVHWEQRGSGKSYTSEMEKTQLSIKDFVGDTIAVSEYLIKEFKKDKIYLVGHSWGTFLAIHAISLRPDLYHSYLGIGQFVNAIEAERLSREYTMEYLQQSGDKAGYDAVKKLGPPPYENALESITLERKYLWKTNGFIAENFSMGKMTWDIFTFPEYSFYDVYRYVKGSIFSLKLLNNGEIWKMELDKQIVHFKIPVYFVSGEYDFTTPSSLVESYYKKIASPEKKFIKISGCAHLPNFENPVEFNKIVIELFKGTSRN